MKITTKAKANSILVNSLFEGKRTLNIMKYDNGKYAWNGKASEYIGNVVENVSSTVKALYVERRTDKDGPYAQVMCICE
jgi:hypothetical protein